MLQFIQRLIFGRKITKKQCKNSICYIDRASNMPAKQAIIEYDKIYHHILKDLGYSGSFGQILKRNPREISQLNDVWEVHKLRNSLVHEMRDHDSEYLERMKQRYKKLSLALLDSVTRKK